MAKSPKFKEESNEEWQTRNTNFKEALDELSEQADAQREDKERIDILRQLERELEDGSVKKGSMAEALLKKEIERLKNTNLKDNKSDSVSGGGESRETRSKEPVSSKVKNLEQSEIDHGFNYSESSDPASEKYFCAACGARMGKNKFCENCGTERPKPENSPKSEKYICPSCGNPMLRGRYCGKCRFDRTSVLNALTSGTKKNVTESVTKEGKSIVDDEKDFKNNKRQFRFKSWEGYDIEQLRYALDFANTAVDKQRIYVDLGVSGKDVITEEGKNKFSNQQEALDDIIKKMEARLRELEAGNRRKKDPEPGPDDTPKESAVVVTPSLEETLPLDAKRPENPTTPEEPPELLEVPGTEPIPVTTEPKQLEVPPAPETKSTIEAKDAQKLREMYEVANHQEEKKSRWGYLKERLKGLATVGWWESHLAEKFRVVTKHIAKEVDQEISGIRNINEGAIYGDLVEAKRKYLNELKQKLAKTEDLLTKFNDRTEISSTSKSLQHERMRKEFDFEIENLRADIAKQEVRYNEMVEQRRKQNEEKIRQLSVHGIYDAELYVAKLSAMEEGPTKQHALENLTLILDILDGTEEKLRASLGKHRGGLLKRIFGEQDKTYHGTELLTEEKIARVKRDIFEHCVRVQQSRFEKSDEIIRTIIRNNLDPDWWKRYVATAVEAALWAIAVKFATTQGATDYGPLKFHINDIHRPTVEANLQMQSSGLEDKITTKIMGEGDTPWKMTKDFLNEQAAAGNIDPTLVNNNHVIQEATKVAIHDNGIVEHSWDPNAVGLDSTKLPPGTKIDYLPGVLQAAKVAGTLVRIIS